MIPDPYHPRSRSAGSEPAVHGRRGLLRFLAGLGAAVLMVVACDPTTGVDSDPPEVTITAPVADARFDQGDTITFVGSATDPEDGPLTGSALRWKSDLDGTLGTGGEITVAAEDLTGGGHVITLAATDSDGVTGSATTNVLIIQPPR